MGCPPVVEEDKRDEVAAQKIGEGSERKEDIESTCTKVLE